MADRDQFEGFVDGFDERREADKPAACQVCEAMLPDAVDGALSEAEQRAFERHVAGCIVCSQELEEAQRGAAWLGMLKQQIPEPGPLLLERILAQTTGAPAANSQTAPLQASVPEVGTPFPAPSLLESEPEAVPGWASLPATPTRLAAAWPGLRKPSVWQSLTGAFSLDWVRPMLQPRLAMTTAMAFFSVALTLNLTGVRLSTVSAASLRPAALRRTVADKGAAAVRGFQNMRVVYQAEAQVDDLRSSWQTGDEGAAPNAQPAPEVPDEAGRKPVDKRTAPEGPHGSSHLDFAPMGPQAAGAAKKGV